MKSLGLPPIERLKHGTRSRYVAGCRCADCRNANRLAYHARKAKARAAAAQLPKPAPTLVPQVWTANGVKRIRYYRRACPGVNGTPCPRASHLRKDSGPVCEKCRDRLVWNGNVPADLARAHIVKLQRQGVGIKAIAAATDISRTILVDIRHGRQKTVRAETEQKILDVDRSCVSDGALVPAGRAWQKIYRLLNEGYPAVRLVRLLGLKGSGLQFGRAKMTARNAACIERLYQLLTAEA